MESALPNHWHFNPRSREGSDILPFLSWTAPESISIHAPVKGATVFFLRSRRRALISIHAPVKGATAYFAVS